MTDEELRIRDKFAMHAISGILATQRIPRRIDTDSARRQDSEMSELAETAYRLADAMLAARVPSAKT